MRMTREIALLVLSLGAGCGALGLDSRHGDAAIEPGRMGQTQQPSMDSVGPGIDSSVPELTQLTVDIGPTATGYSSTTTTSTVNGQLTAGTRYAYCKQWGAQVRVGSAYNHWWMLTDVDVVAPGRPARSFVSAYYLTHWGNDEAKDNSGNDLPDCPYGTTPLDVPWVNQNPELPRGCEVTSLTMLLRFAGVTADKLTLASQVDKVPYTVNGLHGNPNDGFVGDMYTFSNPGYGAYHAPIQRLAAQYLPARIVDLTGQVFDDILAQQVANGRPVWVITNATFAPLAASSFITWHTPTGDAQINWEEHSVVITGYDASTVYINDPLDAAHGKDKRLDLADFRSAWEQMGQQAITYLPATP